MEFPGRLVAVFVAVILIVLFPLQYIAQSNNENIDSLVDDRTRHLVDSIRANGNLDISTYEEYVNYLDSTGELYDVEIEDIHPVTGEDVYSLNDLESHPNTDEQADYIYTRSSNELNDSAISFLRNDNANTLIPLSKNSSSVQPLSIQANKKSGTLNSTVNNDIMLYATHTHTDACYAGHRHDASCKVIGRLGLGVDVSIRRGVGINSTTYEIYLRCHSCGQLIDRIVYTDCTSDNGGSDLDETLALLDSIGGLYYNLNLTLSGVNASARKLPRYITVMGQPDASYHWAYARWNGAFMANFYRKENVEWSYWANECNRLVTYLQSNSGIQYMQDNSTYFFTILNWNFKSEAIGTYGACPYCAISTGVFNYSCGLVQDENPICDRVVTNITATVPSQTVYANGSIVTTATATYLDGHTGTVNCTSNFNSNLIGAQIVTLTYSGLVGNAKTTGTRTCNVNVTVKANTIPSSLSVIPSASTVYNGTEPTYTVTVTYENGTTKGLSSAQYTKTGWSAGPGTKTVNFSYTENGIIVSKSITITVLPNVSSLTVVASMTTVYNGTEPTYTVTQTYENGSIILLSPSQYTKTGWSAGPGTKTVLFSYTENGKTVTGSIIIIVKPNLTSITALPDFLSIIRYTVPSFTVTAHYEDGTTREAIGYSVTGLNINILGPQNLSIFYTENHVTKNTTVTITVTNLTKICPICNTVYELDSNDTDNGCPTCAVTMEGIHVSPTSIIVQTGDVLPITVSATYRNGKTSSVLGWTSNYDSRKTGLQIVTVEYRGYAVSISVWVDESTITCPICGTQYPIRESRCPVCAVNVISISALPGNLTVLQNEVINLTVAAYYADGSSELVADWSIDRTSAESGTFTATVSYRNVSTTITLTVNSLTAVVCPICGLVYEPSDNLSGCPVCSTLITGIEVYMTSGSNLVQYGSIPSIVVVLIFKDTHRELTTEGYSLENYDSTKMGTQSVIVHYNEFSTTIIIEVVNTLSSIMCPKGHVYYLNEDGSDPGCPYCSITDNVETVYYFDITYSSDILDAVYTEGAYYFKEGNYITLKVTKRDISLLSKMQKMFFKTSMIGRKKRFTYGGEV